MIEGDSVLVRWNDGVGEERVELTRKFSVTWKAIAARSRGAGRFRAPARTRADARPGVTCCGRLAAAAGFSSFAGVDRLETPQKFFHGYRTVIQRDTAFGYWDGGIALHQSHWRHGLSHDAAGGDHGSAANHDVGQDDGARADEGILFDAYALRLAEMGHHSNAHAERSAVANGDEPGTRGLQNYVVADPRVFTNVYAARAVQLYAQSLCARQDPGEVLADAILQGPERILFHLFSLLAEAEWVFAEAPFWPAPLWLRRYASIAAKDFSFG